MPGADVRAFEVKTLGTTVNQVSLNLLVYVCQATPFLQVVSPIGGEGGTGLDFKGLKRSGILM